MILIKDAINSGIWLHRIYTDFHDRSLNFGLKILSFRELNLMEVDDSEKIDIKDEGSTIWILEIEVVNMSQDPISTHEMNELILIDQDGFKFHAFDDDHLRFYSQFAKKTKMNRLFGSHLIPKIKAKSAVPFQLPDDDEAVYFISVKNGSIKEA